MVALLVILVVLFVIIFTALSGISNKSTINQQNLNNINEKLNAISQQLEQLNKTLQKGTGGLEKKSEAEKEEARLIIPEVKPKEPVIVIREKKEELVKEHKPAVDPILPGINESEELDERKFREKERSVKPNSDMERFIGENLANKIGIAVLVLGIAFFVKYAIDKNWINETGRVIIGLISGGILIGFAHYFRNSYRSFSSVLVGGGLTVFYFTIAFAFHEYQLISQTAAFIIMVVISAFAVLLSLYYARQELAILATIGGFITPFLVTTGQENYIALFTYLCILNAGIMVLAWFKRWPAINSIALFFTTVIFGGWLVRRTIFENPETLPYVDAFIFASLFYVLFVAMSIINALRLKQKFTAFDFMIVLSINFLYYAAGISVLGYGDLNNLKGLFTLSLGVANLLLAAIFYRKQHINRNFVSLQIGLCLSFISLAVPVEFDGNHIVLFWAAESVLLFWLYQRSKIIHLKIGSLVVAVLMLGSLFTAWGVDYFTHDTIMPIAFNEGFITTLAASVALFIYYVLLRKEKERDFLGGISNRMTRNILMTTTILIAYLAGVFEIYYQFGSRFPEENVSLIYLQAYSFAVAILVLSIFKRSTSFPLLKFLLTAVCLSIYLLNLGINSRVSLDLLTGNNSYLFLAHWVAAVLMFWLLYDMVVFFFKTNNWPDFKQGFTWLATISIVILLSVELYHINLWSNYRDAEDWIWWENLYYKAGLSILWGICSFIMMWLGMKYSFRTLRIISLSLFTLTLGKLFGFDIRNIPPGGKIAAFILLGILLLTISFMYQRLKKIIIDDVVH